jgi:hypothetical protein
MMDEDANPLVVMDGEKVVGLISHAHLVRLLVVEESDEPTPADG